MSRPVLVAAPAQAQIEAIDAWCRANRSASPDLFAQELADAFSTIGLAPHAGHRYRHADVKGVRRVPLRATHNHVTTSPPMPLCSSWRCGERSRGQDQSRRPQMSSGAVDEQYGAQLRPFLRITRCPYEEPYHLNLLVAASNGRLRGEIEIYANADDLGVVAARLRRAPETDRSLVWELGSERAEDRFAFYFCLRTVRQSPSGACVLALRFNNNAHDADREVTEFSIPVLPADLDRLASLLERFRSFQHLILWWTPVDGELLREDAARYDPDGA